MNIAVISSTKDIASTNIKDNLITNFKFNKLKEQFDNNGVFKLVTHNKDKRNNDSNKIIKLYTINSELIFADNLDKKINADVFVFISKHRAQEDRASLTCHAIGNFGNAEHGGKDRALCYSNPILLKKLFIELNNNAKEPYEATLEATHHGPYMEKPVLFVELGSNEKYWKDAGGGLLVAKSLMSALEKFDGFAAINKNFNNNFTMINNSTNKNYSYNKKNESKTNKNENSNNEPNIDENNNSIEKNNINKVINNNENNSYESVFVVGGNHYNHVANKAMLQSNLAVGHICAKYNLESLNENLIKEAMEKISPKPNFILLDWKGLGKEKSKVVDLLENNHIEFKRSDNFLKR